MLLFSCAFRAKPADPDQLPAELMLRSGLEKQLEQVSRTMQAVLDRSRAQDLLTKSFPQSEFDELSRQMEAAFDARSLKGVVQKRIVSDLTESDIRTVLAWLNSPLGRRITKIEEEASSPEAYAQRQAAGGTTAGDGDRIARLRKLDKAVNGTESALNAALSMQVALLTAVSTELPPEQRSSVDEIVDIVKQTTPDWRTEAEQQIIVYYLDTYRALSDVELDQYLAFAESASGRKYHSAMMAGVMDSMLEASRELGRRIGQRPVQKRP